MYYYTIWFSCSTQHTEVFMTKIIVPKGMTYPAVWSEFPERVPEKALRLTEAELAVATARFPVVCTDLVLVDDQSRFVLAKRLHPCAKGWWWKGGGLAKGVAPDANIATLMMREIGAAPEEVVFLNSLYHEWYDTRERPGGHRTDLIFLHVAMVTEEEIQRIVLDSKEYDIGAGFLRYRPEYGVQVRPVVGAMYRRFQRLRFEQPELFVR